MYKGRLSICHKSLSWHGISNLWQTATAAALLGSTWNSTCVCCIEIWNPGPFPKAENHLCFSKKKVFLPLLGHAKVTSLDQSVRPLQSSPIRDTSITQSKNHSDAPVTNFCRCNSTLIHKYAEDGYFNRGGRKIDFYWPHLNATYIPNFPFL